MKPTQILRILVCTLALSLGTGCVGMAIGTATDAAIAVGKVPFKVGGAVVDVATGDEEEPAEKDSEDRPPN